MPTEQNPPLHIYKAPMLAALDAHRHWLANLKCLRQVQLQADDGLLEADDAFGAELANAPSFNAVFTSQLAFINRQLAVQHLIWQGGCRWERVDLPHGQSSISAPKRRGSTFSRIRSTPRRIAARVHGKRGAI